MVITEPITKTTAAESSLPLQEPTSAYDKEGYSRYFPKDRFHPTVGSWRMPPLKLGTLNDLVTANNYQAADLPPKYWGLQEYVRTSSDTGRPAYFFDHHNIALFGWSEALVEKHIKKGATLVHFDAHDDFSPSPITLHDPYDLREASAVAKKLKYTEFIECAMKAGIVNKVLYVSPLKAADEADIWESNSNAEFIEIGPDSPLLKEALEQSDPKDIIGDFDVDYFMPHTQMKADLYHYRNLDTSIPISKIIDDDLAKIRLLIAKAGVTTTVTSPPSLYQFSGNSAENPNPRAGFLDQTTVIDWIKRAF